MNIKRYFLAIAGVALISWGGISAIQAYTIKPAQLQVRVIALGQGIAGSEVTVGNETAETGINGTAIFELMPGIYEVTVKGAHGGSASDTIRLEENELRLKSFELGVEGALPHGGHH